MSLRGPQRQLSEAAAVVPQVFECVALGRPTSPALKDAGHHSWITYHHLNERANKLARCILKRLLSTTCSNPDGDRVVAVCMAPSSHYVTSLLAIHKAGAAYLPLEVTFPEARLTHILKDSKPALLLAQGHPSVIHSGHTNPQLQNNVPILHLEDLQTEIDMESGDDLTAQEVGVALTGSTIATILYTSGSSGIPKGVRLSHRALLNRLAWQWQTFPYQKDEVCCFKTTIIFVDSISEIFGPLLTGHQVVVIPKTMTQAVDEMVAVLEKEKVGRLVLVPSLLRSILLHCSADDSPKLSSLKLWVCSGEVLKSDLLHSFFETFTSGQTLCNFYGSTEVMGDVTYLQFCNSKDAAAKLVNNKVPIGVPITNCWIYLLNTDEEQVKEGQMGEVYVGGLNVASGYVGGAQPEKFIMNKHSDDQNYSVLYRTGDFGRIVDGVVVFEGRLDSQIKVRGNRVELNEVEMAMLKVEGIDKVYILCYNPGEINQALVAFYTSTNKNLVPEVLKAHLASLLLPYMQPQLVHMDELPLLVNGKVDRQQLLSIYEQNIEDYQVDDDLSGVSDNEEAAARAVLLTVARVLGPTAARGKHLSLNASFFEIGGNSLNSVMTVTTLKDLGYNIDIGVFLKAKTLKDIVANLKSARQQEDSSALDVCRQATENNEYTLLMLNNSHRDAVTALVSESFTTKGDLEMWLRPEPWEYVELINTVYDHLVEKELSFVLTRRGSDEVVGCALNLDFRDEPPMEGLSHNLEYILTILDVCETPARTKLPEEIGTVLHGFMMGTLLELGPAENVELIKIMEEENLKLATKKGFKAIVTTNTSPLTQQVCDDVLSYQVLHDYQINLWVAADGTKPFGSAPDSQHIITTAKFL
ncbi:beta-alanyl-bioamine nonribosomal peptide synthetase ebony isoform X2 [Procambarus clarkii]